MKTLPRRRWLHVITGMMIYMCLGTVYSWSVFRTPLEQKLGIGSTESGIPYLVFLVCFTISMLILGKLTDRLNPRVMILTGGAMVGLGWILAGLVQSFTLVVVFNGILAGCGVGTVYGAPIKFISGIFDKNRGTAIGLLVGGFGLSPPYNRTRIPKPHKQSGGEFRIHNPGCRIPRFDTVAGLVFQQAGRQPGQST